MTAPPYPPSPQRRERPRIPGTTFVLSAIMTTFLLQVFTGAWRDPLLLQQWSVSGYDVFVRGEYWRLLTAIFLHGNGTPGITLVHLALNVLSLFQLGFLFETRFGARRLLLVFFVTGLVASLASAWANRGPSVGASGAVFGIVGAYMMAVVRSPRLRRERFARSIVSQLVVLTIINIGVGSTIPMIDMSAHIGGLVAGMVIGAILPHQPPPPPPPAEVVIDVTPYGAG